MAIRKRNFSAQAKAQLETLWNAGVFNPSESVVIVRKDGEFYPANVPKQNGIIASFFKGYHSSMIEPLVYGSFEVFYFDGTTDVPFFNNEDGEKPGWYWWERFPPDLDEEVSPHEPDSAPMGPYDNSFLAYNAALDGDDE